MTQPQLTFKCPINLNDLKGEGSNKFCDQCSKCVTDFSDEKGKLDIYKNDSEPCGIFKPEQLHKPFGDFRDYFVGFYQRRVEKQKVSSSKYSFMLVASTALLFLVSCASRRVAGATIEGWNYNEPIEQCDSSKIDLLKDAVDTI